MIHSGYMGPFTPHCKSIFNDSIFFGFCQPSASLNFKATRYSSKFSTSSSSFCNACLGLIFSIGATCVATKIRSCLPKSCFSKIFCMSGCSMCDSSVD